ncbi:MAG TPA: calcium-binding protein, partial [Alphaproteobacteria bacterium]|nr:calcium-binding protein [Alphaproteobacteria bacterium]
ARFEQVDGATWQIVHAGGTETLTVAGTIPADGYRFVDSVPAPQPEPEPEPQPEPQPGETRDGTAGDDEMTGTTGDDDFFGAAGADMLVGNDGNDILLGGDGDDLVFGDAGSDWIDGQGGRDLLHGGDEDDILAGGTGYDVLDGGAGSDWLVGGQDDDLFVFLRGEADGDRVLDFEGGDELVFEGYGEGAALEKLEGDLWAVTYEGGSEQIEITGTVEQDDYMFV